jgi:cell division protein FtsB
MVRRSRPLPRVVETAEASDPTGRMQAVVIRSLQRGIVQLRAELEQSEREKQELVKTADALRERLASKEAEERLC